MPLNSAPVSAYFYVDENQQQFGPFSLKDVADMHRTGSLRGDARLFSENATTVHSVHDLLAAEGLVRARAKPEPAPRCRGCRRPVVATDAWCTECGASTRDFVQGRLASPGKRFAAWLIDGAIPSGIGASVGAAVAGVHRPFAATMFSLALGIWACLSYSRGTTPGKSLLGMKVLDKDGDPAGFWRMIAREWFAKPLSGVIFGLGYLSILINDEKQGWHDMWCDTHVVEPADD